MMPMLMMNRNEYDFQFQYCTAGDDGDANRFARSTFLYVFIFDFKS